MVRAQIIVIILFAATLMIFIKTTKKEVVYVTSTVDNNRYLVRDLPDKQQAADMLARLKKKIDDLVIHLSSNKDKFSEYKPYIEQLETKINDVVINESSEDSMYTSYSVNKGEQIVFCLRSKKNRNQLHDINLVTYVLLHELAHVGCPEYGHTPLFKKIFAFFTNEGIKIGIYEKIPFNQEPAEYCGLTITESIV